MRLRKATAFILVFIILISAVYVIPSAETEGIYTYNVVGDSAYITRINYNGIKKLTIPETLGGYPVTTISQIGNTTFFGSANMVEELYIPSWITNISWGALRTFDCAKVVVDENNPNYSSDEYGVVFNKDKTVLVACPCSLQNKEYVLPDTVKEISYCAFEKCAFIEKIVLPEGLENLGNQSFCQMPRLRGINIPEGITDLGQNMFIQCSSLETIELPSTLKIVTNSSLSETPLKNVVVPNGVTELGTYAFESCKSLEFLELPVTLKTIGYEAIANCNSLKYIFYRGSEDDWSRININSSNDDNLEKYKIVFGYDPENGYPGIGYTFEDGLLTLTGDGAVPSFSQGDYHYWDNLADKCDVMTVNGSISRIGTYAFAGFSLLEYLIVYPDEFTFEDNAFSNCKALENVIITGTADFTDNCFDAAEGLRIFIDSDKNPGLEKKDNIIRFTYSDGTLNFIDGVSFDMYHLLDLVSALAKKYGVIRRITFGNMTLTDVELDYISEYTEKNEPVIKAIEGNTLVNGEISVAGLSGSALSFNELIDIISDGGADGFMLIASNEYHQTIINQNIGIEEPVEQNKPQANEEPDIPPGSGGQVNPPVNNEPEEQATGDKPDNNQQEDVPAGQKDNEQDNPSETEEPESSATDDEPVEQEDNGVLDEIILVLETVYTGVVQAIKWAVTLMNKLFKVIKK